MGLSNCTELRTAMGGTDQIVKLCAIFRITYYILLRGLIAIYLGSALLVTVFQDGLS